MSDTPATSAPVSEKQASVPVWDLPTRLFHWLLVGSMASAWLTYQFGDVNMTYHKWTGYVALTLVTYRVLWGVFGSNTARFGHFVRGPGAALAYMKSLRGPHPQKVLGHNPVGGAMVLTLLTLVLVQGAMGLFTTDEILVEGPLVHLVPGAWAEWAGTVHRIGFYVIIAFATAHVSALLFYWLIKRENLIRAMVTGKKPATIVPAGEALVAKPLSRALVLLGVSAGLVWLGINAWAF